MNKPLILVVEDDAPIRNLITTTLKTQDYKYIAAATASEALQQATIHAPDVMLLDLGLPDLDGIEVIRRIRCPTISRTAAFLLLHCPLGRFLCMNKPLILVVEDDAPIRNLITTTLKTQDYKYIAAATASEALQQATIHAPDVMLLDLGLPDLDGIEVIRRIRSWSAMPIIVISARSEDSDKIEALDSGADDYLTKPFSVEELLARLRVTFRRILMLQNAAGSSVFTNGDLQIDFAAGCATLKGQELHLTPIEYKLLCVMAKNCGKVLTHTYITHEVWGSSWGNDVASLRVFMATLRKKLESEADSPQYIQTHIGIGYRMLKV